MMTSLKGTTFRLVSATHALAIAGALTLAGTAHASGNRDWDGDLCRTTGSRPTA